ncbi:hypothetical protein M407DRAFT_153824 [Tulasnella calospora MUT 4182]|uniref:Uncharacterized protein n=1 Tax=Tulasnella calospora MUT 4182 TaxID=1051891 RepID=A0A0C3M9P6_9AGAM|nr:hypothetical protein M407DRAFT_153824 [Tulasnella calospora MUT 4182]
MLSIPTIYSRSELPLPWLSILQGRTTCSTPTPTPWTTATTLITSLTSSTLTMQPQKERKSWRERQRKQQSRGVLYRQHNTDFPPHGPNRAFSTHFDSSSHQFSFC